MITMERRHGISQIIFSATLSQLLAMMGSLIVSYFTPLGINVIFSNRWTLHAMDRGIILICHSLVNKHPHSSLAQLHSFQLINWSSLWFPCFDFSQITKKQFLFFYNDLRVTGSLIILRIISSICKIGGE